MSRIRWHSNRPTELKIKTIFKKYGKNGWHRYQRVFGRPDFVFRSEGVALFVDGCFWHGCRKHQHVPSSNRRFWKNKLEQNVVRDKRVNRLLRKKGWKVIRVWEHAFNKEETLVKRIRRALRYG